MKRILIATVLFLNTALACYCRGDQSTAGSVTNATTAPVGVSTKFQPYNVQAKGQWITLTNAPESNRLHIGFAERRKGVLDMGPGKEPKDGMFFWLTNKEPHAVLVWNVRVQTKSLTNATNGLGWETVQDDYPLGMRNDVVPTGGTEQCVVQHPGKTPWRVAIVYSIDRKDNKRYEGNYEAVSAELKE